MQTQRLRLRVRFLILFTSLIETQNVSCGSPQIGLLGSSAISDLVVATESTAVLNGLYHGACTVSDLDIDLVDDGSTSIFMIDSGNVKQAIQVFDHDPTCSTATSYVSINDGSVLAAPELTAFNLSAVNTDGVPTNFYLLSATEVGSLDQKFYLFYRDPTSGNLNQLQNAIITNQGTLWSDWLSITDILGFSSDPTNYTPAAGGGENGATSSAIFLTKVQ